jgi:hypothetical protein
VILYTGYETEPDCVRHVGDVLADDANEALATATAAPVWHSWWVEPAE